MGRDLVGYGGRPPNAQWPGGARVALQCVLNVEEGAESSVLNGDVGSEAYLHELYGRPSRIGARDPSVESLYGYGSRAGVWRVLDLFAERGLPLTAFAVGRALELNPRVGEALRDAGHEVAGHGWRWIDHHGLPEDVEREHIRRTVAVIERVCGRRPVGWYAGRQSLNTRRLVREEGFLYTSDAYDDDLPYWEAEQPPATPPGSSGGSAGAASGAQPLLVVPYTLVNNDARYLMPTGFASGDDFFAMLRDALDQLRHEGARTPKMMSVGLHGRISGQPARARALARFLDYARDFDDVWICRREDIARHWKDTDPPGGE